MSDDREQHIDAVVAAAPPLRPDQVARLSALFDTADEKAGADR